MPGVEVGGGQAHDAIRAILSGVRVDGVVQLAIDSITAQHKEVDRGPPVHQIELGVIIDPAEVELVRLGATKLKPVEHALPGFHSVEPSL